jgi:hypothetical protein
MSDIDNHNSGQYLAVIHRPERTTYGGTAGRNFPRDHRAGWWVIRTCSCHDGLSVTRRYDTRDEAEAAAALMLAVTMILGT